jgi:Glycogen recognition site of AMP-activated protein kinase
MITKSYAKNGQSCRVTFQLTPERGARSAAVLGDFNDWRPEAHPMERAQDGSFRLTVSLPAGRSYRFRYLFDGESWANDEAADSFVLNQFGSQDAILDLSAADRPAGEPAAARPKKAAAAKAPAKPAGAKAQEKPAGGAAKKTQAKPAGGAVRTKAAGQKRQPAGEAAAKNAPPANEAAVQAPPPRPAARRRRAPDAG